MSDDVFPVRLPRNPAMPPTPTELLDRMISALKKAPAHPTLVRFRSSVPHAALILRARFPESAPCPLCGAAMAVPCACDLSAYR